MKKRDKAVKEILDFANAKPENAQTIVNYAIGYADGSNSGFKAGRVKGFVGGLYAGLVLAIGYFIYNDIKSVRYDKPKEDEVTKN